MYRISLVALLGGILLLTGGCSPVSNIRIIEDSPGDLGKLIEEHEYVRVRQLTGKHPSLDNPDLQSRLKLHEQEYEQSIWSEAGTLEADGKLHAAVELLSNGLQKLPHSGRLRELRNNIEQIRVYKLRVNEREELLARGKYLASQRRLHNELVKLEPPNTHRQHEHELNQAAAIKIAGLLREHARFALVYDDLKATRACLDLSRKLHDTPETIALHSELQVIEQSLKKTIQKKASIKKIRIDRKQTRVNRQQTQELLEKTQQALDANQLQEARAAFIRIPPSSSKDENVMAVQNNLEHALNKRVEHLTTTGDALYRADKINAALKSWNEALSLDPENSGVRERTERANKVLARLQQLKSQQKR